jgi:hypothetical protein
MSVGLNLLSGLSVLSAGRLRARLKGRIMADRAGLGFVGFIFGGVTAVVMLVAATVVIGHADGRFVLDSAPAYIASNQ